jgi:hypothetical protein
VRRRARAPAGARAGVRINKKNASIGQAKMAPEKTKQKWVLEICLVPDR